MYKGIILFGIVFFLGVWSNSSSATERIVSNPQELRNSIRTAQPGDEIVLANGVWKDIQIHFYGKGTEDKPIILRAKTPGKVSIEGQSCLKIGGEYLIVDGLYFKNGYTPNNTVIDFRISEDSVANHSKVINCVIEDFNQLNRYKEDHWIEFWGRHNQLDHCYFAGKFNRGPTVRVYHLGNEHIKNYHQITNNHFGPRPRKGGARAETIQIGDYYSSMMPSYVMVKNNFFERCNGEVEVISSKTNFNEFRNNIFYECEGSLVVRHGNYCIIDGNFFIGNENSQFTGGIRVINTGHWITNNYFYKIKGEEFRGPLAIMNGTHKAPQNRYHQVTDVVVAYNTWIDCKSAWQISVGANMDQKDVLPAQEIRSERPDRTIIANNIIYNYQTDDNPIKAYDVVDKITFKNNIIDNQNSEPIKYDGIEAKELRMKKISDWLYVPSETQDDDISNVYSGFGFEDIQKDIFGNSRADRNTIGAISQAPDKNKVDFDKHKYGANWYTAKSAAKAPITIEVSPAEGEIFKKITQANDGDILELSEGKYHITESLVINKKITLRSKDENNKAQVIYSGAKDTPLFQMNPKGSLILDDVVLKGEGEQFTFSTLEKNMSSGYNLFVSNSQIEDFKNILKVYKGSFADTISFSNTTIKNCLNGFELNAETDAIGDYNAEFVNIINCKFENIHMNIIDFYRGGYDESTIGGFLTVEGSLFKNCGDQEKSDILLKTGGIINVDISNNTFEQNPVKLIALLWGKKNNREKGNKFIGPGEIRIDQNYKQKLVY